MSNILSIDPDSLSIGERHSLLVSAVAPRPIALVSTIDTDGHVNLSPFSFFNVFSSNPPIMIFSPARRGKNNTTKHTYHNVKAEKECVIGIVNYEMAEQMSLSSSEYPAGVNEFTKSGFTEISSDLVKPPIIAESPVNFECKVQEVIELGTEGAAGNLVICRVVRMHVNKDYLREDGKLDTLKLNLIGRMGSMWYAHAHESALFSIPKPLATPGIGVDQLPNSVKNSPVLSGNDLGRLGNMSAIPSSDDVEAIKLTHSNLVGKEIVDSHVLAKKLIASSKTKEALDLLFAFSNK